MAEKASINEMHRLLAIMNGDTDSDSPRKFDSSNSVDSDVQAMKTILERFSRSADTLISEIDSDNPVQDRPLREAMLMEPTDDGVVVGLWEIKTKTDSGRKLYDVVKVDENTPIASDLTIYEAARGLVQALNDGLPINSVFVRDLLQNEADHANAVHDAIHAKYALKNHRLTESKRELLEDKYSAAFRRASHARHRVLEIFKRY